MIAAQRPAARIAKVKTGAILRGVEALQRLGSSVTQVGRALLEGALADSCCGAGRRREEYLFLVSDHGILGTCLGNRSRVIGPAF